MSRFGTLPFGYVVLDPLDFDGGVIAVPATAVATRLVRVRVINAPFWLDMIIISVLDPGAVPVTTWDLRVNGNIQFPWTAQRLAGTQMTFPFQIGRLIAPQSDIELMAQIPSGLGFDVIGRILGAHLRRGTT